MVEADENVRTFFDESTAEDVTDHFVAGEDEVGVAIDCMEIVGVEKERQALPENVYGEDRSVLRELLEDEVMRIGEKLE